MEPKRARKVIGIILAVIGVLLAGILTLYLMLSNTLKELEQNKIILRKQFNEIPPHTEYSLSESGKELYPVFYEMALWGSKYL